jgi:hypothetical protein
MYLEERAVTRTQEELDLLKKWLTRFKHSEDAYRQYMDKGKENYYLYKSYMKGEEKVYKHSIFVPYTFAYMEDYIAYIMLSIFSQPSIYSIHPRLSSISKELCSELEIILNWVMKDERTEFILEIEDLLRNINLYNVAYLINFPVTKEIQRILSTGETTKSDAFDYIYLESPHTFSMFPEPGRKRLSRANWIIRRGYSTIEELLEAQEKGIYEGVERIGTGGYGTDEDPVKKLLSEIGISIDTPHEKNKIEILDCFEDGDVVTIANKQFIIRNTTRYAIKPYPFPLPVLDARTGGAPGEFFGIGLVESLKPIQKELNLLRSQRRENVSLVLNKLFIYDMTAGEVDLATLFSAPGNVIVTTNRDAIEELPIADVTSSSYKEEQSLYYDFQNVSSFWDYTRGATPRRRETATGIIRLQQASQGRPEFYLKKLDFYILTPLAKRALVYIRETIDRETYKEIVGEPNHADQFFDLDTEQLKRGIGVVPITESLSQVKEIDTNIFIQAFDRLIRFPEVNRVALIKQLWLKLGNKNPEEIVQQLSPPAQEATRAGAKEALEGPQSRAVAEGMGIPVPQEFFEKLGE